jgi:hypothetical protein
VDGITYSNVTWRTITPATASITHRTGAASIPLWKLPPELQARFGYDPQKASEYIAAKQSAEAARQEALRRQRSEEAERQRQAAEIAAAVAATNQATEAAAKKAAQENEVHYGPVTQLRFSYSTAPSKLSDGTYCANVIYSDFNTGAEGRIYVTFPANGLGFMNNCSFQSAGPNGYSAYGRPFTTQLHNLYFGGDVSGAQYTATAYWLVGVNVNTYSGAITW